MVEKYLNDYKELPPRKIYARVRFEKMFGGVYLFDPEKNEIREITSDF